MQVKKLRVGDPVRDKEIRSDIGQVDTVRQDGMVCVRWKSGKTEWLKANDLEPVPGFQSKR